MLLCDSCNRGHHIYCLNPPLSKIPDTDWYCSHCLKSSGNDYGFEDGETRTLPEFQKVCNDFKQEWFSSKSGWPKDEQGKPIITEEDVEKEFWRLVESPYDEVEVEYGADLHSSHHGR